MLRSVVWQKFTDVSDVNASSIIRAINAHRPDDDGGSKTVILTTSLATQILHAITETLTQSCLLESLQQPQYCDECLFLWFYASQFFLF
jgi:hypothetical protein